MAQLPLGSPYRVSEIFSLPSSTKGDISCVSYLSSTYLTLFLRAVFLHPNKPRQAGIAGRLHLFTEHFATLYLLFWNEHFPSSNNHMNYHDNNQLLVCYFYDRNLLSMSSSHPSRIATRRCLGHHYQRRHVQKFISMFLAPKEERTTLSLLGAKTTSHKCMQSQNHAGGYRVGSRLEAFAFFPSTPRSRATQSHLKHKHPHALFSPSLYDCDLDYVDGVVMDRRVAGAKSSGSIGKILSPVLYLRPCPLSSDRLCG